MGKSIKHHYLPQFYLKGFTVDGHFKIFDVKKQGFKMGGKDFPPASHFFIRNDNSTTLDGEFTDFIERSYGDTESEVAKIFSKLKNNIRMSEDDVPYLQYFIAITYWRLPANRHIVKYIALTKSFRELGLVFKDETTGEVVEEPDIEAKAKNDPEYLKWVRQILPYTFIRRFMHCTTPIHVLEFSNALPAVCTDNPIILRRPDKIDVYLDDFIFPLMHNKVLVRINNLKPYWETIKVKIDVLLIILAKEYISCTNKEYLLELQELADLHNSDVNKYREWIFNELEGTL
jgi:hypothetical protein